MIKVTYRYRFPYSETDIIKTGDFKSEQSFKKWFELRFLKYGGRLIGYTYKEYPNN